MAMQADQLAAAFTALPGVHVHRARDEADAVAHLAASDAALLGGVQGAYTPALAAAIAKSPRLAWVQLLSTGMDAIEQHGLAPHVQLTGIGASGAIPVAEHAIALLLALARQLPQWVRQGPQGSWDRSAARHLRTLEGLRLAIAGTGGIGQAAAQRARAFAMQVIGVNRSGSNPDPHLFDEVAQIRDLHAVLATCDALLIALPLTAETRHLFNAPAWRAAKPGLLVVNVGRGALIDTPALLAELAAGQVGGAGLDVTDPEPLPPEHALWQHPNVLISPHVAGGGSPASLRRICALVTDNLGRHTRGEPLLHPIKHGGAP